MSHPHSLLAALDAAYAQQHGSFVVAVADAERHSFAQFAVAEDEVWAEVVGNTFLKPADRLAPTQERALEARGWTLEPSGNWGCAYPGASDANVRHRAALDALSVLSEVFGAQGPLTVEASLAGPGANALQAELSALGVTAPESEHASAGLPLVVLLIGGGVGLIALGLALL